MSQQGKEGGGLPVTGIAAVVLLLVGIIVPQLPLEVTRPAPSHVLRDEYPAVQKMPARLWEDPFAAVAGDGRGRAESHAGGPQLRPRETQPDLLAKSVTERSPAGRPCVSLMPVTVFGGPYGEYSEVRRRTRHAVISGLLRSLYAPEDEDHIGYVRLSSGRGRSAASGMIIPFEWFQRKTSSDLPQAWHRRLGDCGDRESLLVLWLDEDNLSDKPLKELARTLRDLKIPAESIDRVRLVGPAGSKTLEKMVVELGADHKATPADDNAGARYAPEQPVAGFYKDFVKIGDAGVEADQRPQEPRAWNYPTPLEIFVWGATTPPAQLTALARRSFDDQFAKHGVTLVRAVADDLSVIGRIKPELQQRGILLGRDPIAIVSESETSYGRQLTALIKSEVGKHAQSASDRPHAIREDDLVLRFNYFRGLDGETAFSAEAPLPNRTEKDEKRRDSARVETSSGLAQLDYARRIAAAVRKRHDELRAVGSRIAAIGIFGTDFYDKSLILQALKKEMPQAVFFTTDLDARMTDANQSRWSRNLLVFSGLGLSLHPDLQGGIGPFRDTYQTATFLATLLAVNTRIQHPEQEHAWRREGEVSPHKASTLAVSHFAPRAYEVGRHTIFDYGRAVRSNKSDSEDNDQCSPFTFVNCKTIYPRPSAFMQLEGARNIIFAALIVLSAVSLVLMTSRFARVKLAEARVQARKPGMVLVMFACATLAVWGFVLAWSDSLVREPFRWAEGFSAWPSLMLRYVAAVFSVWFLYALMNDHENMLKVMERFKLPSTIRNQIGGAPWWARKLRKLVAGRPYLRGRALWSIYRWVNKPGAQCGRNCAVDVARDYLVLANADRRFDRVAPVVVCYVLLGFALVWLWDSPGVPIRGAGTRLYAGVLLLIYIVAYSFLLFAVVDAVRLLDAFVEKLMLGDAAYGEKTLSVFREELKLRKSSLVDHYLSNWIDVQLIAEQTESTIRLVYYPFIILAVWMISRSQIFDDWYTPVSLGIIFLLGAVYTAFATLRLRKTAERARNAAISRMTKLLIAVRGQLGGEPQPPVLIGAASPGAAAVENLGNPAQVLGQLEIMLDQVKTTQRGAFMPLTQQPLWKAVLLPLSGFGGIEVLQYLWVVNN